MKDIRNKLPRGYAKQAAIRFNCSERKVYNTASGLTRGDTDLLLWLVNLAKEHSDKCAKIEQAIEDLQ